MQLIEALSKEILARYEFPHPTGRLVRNHVDGVGAADEIGSDCMVKAQLPISGRAKRGMVVRCDGSTQVGEAIVRLSAMECDGLLPEWFLVESYAPHQQELYLAETYDYALGAPIILLSGEGGIEVERGGQLQRIEPHPLLGVPEYAVRVAGLRLGLSAAAIGALVSCCHRLHRAFVETDALLIEVNPLGVTAETEFIMLDARVVTDNAAAFRQPEIGERALCYGPQHVEDLVRIQKGIDWVPLDGTIGLLSGGAGMTMACMDMIAHAGGRPACFLDCSPNPTVEGYTHGLKLLEGHPGVRTILINIVGGGNRVDRVAEVLVEVLAASPTRKPIFIRLEGTGADQARLTMESNGHTCYTDLELAVSDCIARSMAL